MRSCRDLLSLKSIPTVFFAEKNGLELPTHSEIKKTALWWNSSLQKRGGH